MGLIQLLQYFPWSPFFCYPIETA